MRAARSIVFVIWLYASMGVVGILGLPSLLISRRATLGVMKFYCRCVLWGLRWICDIHVEVRGSQHLPGGPALIAGKHQAMLDVFIPFLAFPDPMVVMKRELLWYPVLGWYAYRAGMIPIDRAGSSQTVRAMIKAAKTRMEEGPGRQLVIFPEGTRQAPGAPPDYKPAGIRAFYKALGVSVVPSSTNSGLCWPARGVLRRSGRVVYEFLPPLPAGQSPKTLVAELETQIEKASDRLLQEGLDAQGRTRQDLS